jgi:hypothetical protein
MHLMPYSVETGALRRITLMIQNICNLDFLESSRRIQLSQEAGFIRVKCVCQQRWDNTQSLLFIFLHLVMGQSERPIAPFF